MRFLKLFDFLPRDGEDGSRELKLHSRLTTIGHDYSWKPTALEEILSVLA
jgi:hypothetical protein